MIGLTPKHLRYLDALARHGHFGPAAEACAISQPALSLQIKELEMMLGAPLVERATRQIRLTPLGDAFVARAREILLSVDELAELARAAQGPLAGRLRMGVIPTVAPYLLPRIIAALTDRFPDLDLELRESVTTALIGELQESRLDAAVLALPISEPSLREFALFEEDFVLVRSQADAGLPVPSPERLQTMRLLLLEEGHCFRDQALSFCNLQPALPRDGLDGSSLSTLVQMVGAGLGVTLIPEMALPVETRSAPVAVSRFAAPEPRRTVGMIWRKTSPMDAQLHQTADAVRRAAEDLRRQSAGD